MNEETGPGEEMDEMGPGPICIAPFLKKQKWGLAPISLNFPMR